MTQFEVWWSKVKVKSKSLITYITFEVHYNRFAARLTTMDWHLALTELKLTKKDEIDVMSIKYRDFCFTLYSHTSRGAKVFTSLSKRL